jgi:restriction endonuclease S subunit
MSKKPSGKLKALSASFSDLKNWSVSSQFTIDWQWPENDIRPLGQVLQRRSEASLDTLTADTVVTLLTIRFDGSIEPRDPVAIKDVKGKLFRVYPGDVVFSKIDVRNGAIGLAPDGIGCMCVTTEFPVYSVNTKEATSGYVKLLFRTQAFMAILNSMISGASGRKRIQPSQLEGVVVPIPAKSLQKKIERHWLDAREKQIRANSALGQLVSKLNLYLCSQTNEFELVTRSRVFVANYSKSQQWDLKAGRAAAFIKSNPSFIKLGDFTEECTETVRPWEKADADWPIYGVNNKTGVFFNTNQLGREFNAPYKIIKRHWFFHNPTRANVGSIGIVNEVPGNAVTSPEYQVWKLTEGLLPDFMSLMTRTDYFLALVSFNRVGGVKQRMYYSNLAEIRLPSISIDIQKKYIKKRESIMKEIVSSNEKVIIRRRDVEKMILGKLAIEK